MDIDIQIMHALRNNKEAMSAYEVATAVKISAPHATLYLKRLVNQGAIDLVSGSPQLFQINSNSNEWIKQAEARTQIPINASNMTLRDYFAGKAMQGLLSNPKLSSQILAEGGAFSGWIEKSAWAWADALMYQRGKDNR